MMGLPQEVVSVLGNVAHDNAEVEDLSVSVLRYPSAMATVTASVVHHGERQALTAQCEKACIAVPHQVYASQSLPTGFPREDPELEEQLNRLYAAQPALPYEGHTAQIDNVLTCLEQGGTTPAITGEDGRRTIELITAIYKAGATRQPCSCPSRRKTPSIPWRAFRPMRPIFMKRAPAWRTWGTARCSREITSRAERILLYGGGSPCKTVTVCITPPRASPPRWSSRGNSSLRRWDWTTATLAAMCNGLMEAGATLKWIYDPDPAKVEQYCKMYPQARAARSEAEVLEDPEVRLVAGACVTSQRCALGLRVMAAGKDYFTDKAPLTTLEQLAAARKATAETGRKYMCYYSERLHVESAVYAGQLIAQGALARC